jgi:hypothetical protein
MKRTATRKPQEKILVLVVLITWIAINGCSVKSERKSDEVEDIASTSSSSENNTLTEEEKAGGWRLLFDGKTFAGWRSLGRESVPENLWEIDQESIHKINTGDVASLPDGRPAEGGDLITVEKFDKFELSFEWRVEPGGNTGLKYNVSEEMSLENGVSALGFEYQLGDDGNDPDSNRKASHRVGALYDLFPTYTKVEINPIDQFNKSRLLVRGNQVEHWLNGEKILAFEFGSDQLDSTYKISKFKNIKDFHKKRKGHLVLQNHKDDAWFRNLKIRELM